MRFPDPLRSRLLNCSLEVRENIWNFIGEWEGMSTINQDGTESDWKIDVHMVDWRRVSPFMTVKEFIDTQFATMWANRSQWVWGLRFGYTYMVDMGPVEYEGGHRWRQEEIYLDEDDLITMFCELNHFRRHYSLCWAEVDGRLDLWEFYGCLRGVNVDGPFIDHVVQYVWTDEWGFVLSESEVPVGVPILRPQWELDWEEQWDRESREQQQN